VLIGGLVFLVLLGYNVMRKKPKKTALIGLAVCFALCITGLSISSPSSTTNDDKLPIETSRDDSSQNKQTVVTKEESVSTGAEKGKPADVIKEVDRKSEIEALIKDRINDDDYKNTKLDRITINENLGTDTPNDYIALVYFEFDIQNTRKTGNEVMRMYSDDLVATLAENGVTDISEAVIFWEDEYNNRTVKYAFEYRNGGFYITDIMGE